MDFELNYSPEVQEDLEHLYAYVKENFYADEIAQKSIDEILDGVDYLMRSPEIGIDFDKKIGRKIGREIDDEYNTRLLILGRKLVFYLAYENEAEIYVLRVLNARQDYMRFISQLSKNMTKHKKNK